MLPTILRRITAAATTLTGLAGLAATVALAAPAGAAGPNHPLIGTNNCSISQRLCIERIHHRPGDQSGVVVETKVPAGAVSGIIEYRQKRLVALPYPLVDNTAGATMVTSAADSTVLHPPSGTTIEIRATAVCVVPGINCDPQPSAWVPIYVPDARTGWAAQQGPASELAKYLHAGTNGQDSYGVCSLYYLGANYVGRWTPSNNICSIDIGGELRTGNDGAVLLDPQYVANGTLPLSWAAPSSSGRISAGRRPTVDGFGTATGVCRFTDGANVWNGELTANGCRLFYNGGSHLYPSGYQVLVGPAFL